ncbi:MAG: DNA recombination protein RmuC [Terriglobales bacterium]
MTTEIVLTALLVFAAIIIAYLIGTRRQAGFPVTASPPDLRVQGAIDPLPQIQQDLGSLKTAVEKLPSDATVTAIDSRLKSLEAIVNQRLPTTLPTDLDQLDQAVQAIRSEYEPGKRIGEIHDATKRVMVLLAGGSDRGAAGEAVLADSLRQLPPEMLERDFRVDGKRVEFALVLPNGKRLPIDSKWPESDTLEKLEKETDFVERQKLGDVVEKAVAQRASEVAKYRNPSVTTDVAIAAVPDAAYRVCRKAHIQAYKDSSVLVIPYSMVAPYVLAFFHLHLKYGQTIELSNLQAYLGVIEQELKKIDTELEGRVKEAGTRANYAYQGITASLAKIRAASDYLRAAPESAAPETNQGPSANGGNAET